MWEYGDIMSPTYPNSGLHSAELGSTPTQSTEDQSNFSLSGPQLDNGIHLDLRNPRNYATWFEMQAAVRAPQMANFYPTGVSPEYMTQDNTALDQSFNHIETNVNNIPLSAFSEWGSSKGNSVAWTPANQRDNPFDDSHLLLQQSTSHSFVQSQNIQHPLNDVDRYAMYQNNTVASPNQFIAQQNHTPSPQQLVEKSPEPSTYHNELPNQIKLEIQKKREPQTKTESHSRKGSDSSDLANNFDTFHLQKLQSQQNSDEEVFKTPPIPNQNLAARRKQRRPAALGSVAMRSHSCTGPQESSPINKSMGLGLSKSVRRIKSTGNSLNVRSGRIQKSGVASAQRSPLSYQSFHEAGAFDHVDAFAAQSTDTSQATIGSNTGPLTPHTPSVIEDSSLIWNKSVHFQASPNVLHSQTFPISSLDGPSQVSSPPKTPFSEMRTCAEAPVYVTQYPTHYPAPPQSAPPQLTSFSNTSPPNQPTPTTPSNFIIPQAGLPEPYGYYPMSQIHQQSLPMFHYGQSQPSVFAFHPPQIHNNSPPMGSHSIWNVNPAPVQQKEMEFIIQDFPQPPPPPKEPHQTKQYTFQNSGPEDF